MAMHYVQPTLRVSYAPTPLYHTPPLHSSITDGGNHTNNDSGGQRRLSAGVPAVHQPQPHQPQQQVLLQDSLDEPYYSLSRVSSFFGSNNLQRLTSMRDTTTTASYAAMPDPPTSSTATGEHFFGFGILPTFGSGSDAVVFDSETEEATSSSNVSVCSGSSAESMASRRGGRGGGGGGAGRRAPRPTRLSRRNSERLVSFPSLPYPSESIATTDSKSGVGVGVPEISSKTHATARERNVARLRMTLNGGRYMTAGDAAEAHRESHQPHQQPGVGESAAERERRLEFAREIRVRRERRERRLEMEQKKLEKKNSRKGLFGF